MVRQKAFIKWGPLGHVSIARILTLAKLCTCLESVSTLAINLTRSDGYENCGPPKVFLS